MARVLHSAKHDPHGQTPEEYKDIKVGQHTMCHMLLNFHNKLSTEVALVWDQKTQQDNQRSRTRKKSMCNERRVTSKQKTKIKASGICAQNQTRKEFPWSRKLGAGN